MNRSGVRITILCEDTQQAAFARRFLEFYGVHRRELRSLVCPPGSEAASKWVVDTFPKELSEYRRRRNSQQLALIIMIDADSETAARRQAWLEQACGDAKVPGRAPDETVLYLVPRRNIETWFAFLRGEAVNEIDPYPRYDLESECQADAKRLDQVCRAGTLPGNTPESLRLACEEYVWLRKIIRRLP